MQIAQGRYAAQISPPTSLCDGWLVILLCDGQRTGRGNLYKTGTAAERGALKLLAKAQA